MAAPIGNKFWKKRSCHGPNPKFYNPDDLWLACVDYFEWNETNPLQEEKIFHFQGKIKKTKASKMRAMSLMGLVNFLDISFETWRIWREKREDLFEVIESVESIIRQQKFEGAAANLLNSSIIARDLGLVEKTASEFTGQNGGPVQVETMQLPYQPTKEEWLELHRKKISGE